MRCNLLMREPAEERQCQDLARQGIQRSKRSVHLSGRFACLEQIAGRRLGVQFIGSLDLRRDERHVCVRTSKSVERSRPRDRQYPSERPTAPGVEAIRLAPHLKEHIFGHFFRNLRTPHDTAHQTVNPPQHGIVQQAERRFVTFRNSLDPAGELTVSRLFVDR